MQRNKTFSLLLFILLIGNSNTLLAVTKTWVAGTASNWNTAGNWSPSGVPGAADVATFNSSGLGSCTINATVVVAGINVQSLYTGTISQGAFKMTIGTSNAIFAAGTFTGGSLGIICNGAFTLSGTTFTSTSDTLQLNSTVTSSGGTFANNNGKVRFLSTAAQTVPAWMYNNLYIAGAHVATSVTLASGTIGVAGAFENAATFTKGGFIKTGNTINYNGGNSQNVIAFNYNNLSLSGYHSIKNITLANTGTIGVFGAFSNTATFSTGTIIITGSTIDFNSTSAQTISAFNYHNLTYSSTGSRTLVNTGTIFVANTFTKGTNQLTTIGSTVNYNGTVAQPIIAIAYNNLTISGSHAGNITLASTGTIGIAGTFTNSASFSSGGYVVTGSTVDFNGATQNIPAFTFNNLTNSGTGDKTATGAIVVNAVLTVSSGRILNLGTNLLTGITTTSGTGILKTQNTSAAPIPASKTWAFGVEYNGAGQSIAGGTYSTSLTCSGSGTKTAVATFAVNGTITVATSCTMDMSTFALSGTIASTVGPGLLKTQNGTATPIPVSKTWNMPVEYYGTLAQSAVVGTYKDLTISGARGANSFTLASGTINISGVFVVTMTGTIVKTGNLINYNGTGAQTIIAINYNNLTISNARGSNNVTLASSGTIGIAGALSNTATYTQGVLVISGSTVNFNGTGAQTITATTYNNLSISGAHTTNSITLPSGTTTVQGNYNNTATFTSGVFVTTGNTTQFSGTVNQYISGSATGSSFSKLLVNKSAGKLRLTAPVTITQQLILTKGIIGTSATNIITYNNATDTVIGGSDSSYVSGPMKKVGNQLFNFPLGDTVLATGAFHPFYMTAPSAAGDAFTGQYFAANPTTQPLGSGLQPDTLLSISGCEYWSLTRAGTSIVLPKVSWNTNTCNAITYDDFRVAYWDVGLSQWKALVSGSTFVNGYTGTVSALSGYTYPTATAYYALAKGPPTNYCAILKRELDGGYHIVNNGNLTFKYDEEYADQDGKLKFNIYSVQNVVIATNLTMPTLLQPSSNYGDNRVTLNIASCSFLPTGNLGSGFFILEVINEKDEKWYLRFKHNISIFGLCTVYPGVWSP